MTDEFREPAFRTHSDSGEIICPYCQHRFQPEAEDYSEDSREHECSECEKKFWMYQVFSVDHYSKPDCELNGERHKWELVHRHPASQSCVVCDKWRSTPADARAALNRGES